MAKKTPAQKSARAAMDAAATAAADAKKLSRLLPAQDAKRLRALADRAKDASTPAKEQVASIPAIVEWAAASATRRLTKTASKLEAKNAVSDDKKMTSKRASKKTPRETVHEAAEKAAHETLKTAKKATKKATRASKKRHEEIDRAKDAMIERVATSQAGRAPRWEAMTVTDLRARARDAGLEGYSRMSKPQLIALLSE